MLKTIKELIDLMKGQKTQLWVSLFISFIDGILNIIPLIMAFKMIGSIREIFPETQTPLTTEMVIRYAVIMVGVLCLRILLRYFTLKLRSSAAYIVMNNERKTLAKELFDVSMGYFSFRNLGDLVSVITSDLSFIEIEGVGIVEKASTGIPSAIFGILILFYFDIKIGLLVIILLIPTFFAYRHLSHTQDRLKQNRPVVIGKATQDVVDFINGLHVLKSFSMAEKRISNTEKSFEELRVFSEKLELTHLPPAAVYQICFKVITAAIIFMTALLTLKGEIDYAEAFLLMLGSFSLFSALEAMGIFSVFSKMTKQSIDRINQIKDIPKMNNINGTEVPEFYGVSFENVCFSYEENPVIKNVSFEVPENSMTALIGLSGSGKTTMINLISRFWDTSQGTIKIGGKDVRDIPYNKLLESCSFVFQDVFLFNDTILNNIRIGKPHATDNDVIEVAKRTGCHDFIMAKKDGYATMAGEAGEALSGGEKQRISIARALLKDTPIVLLDEMTANIDVENEYLIKEAISELLKNRTVITIAHKLSNVRQADQILVIEDGQIGQRGVHEELVKEEGLYRHLWIMQSETAAWSI